ncbi:hypothetical protein MKW98_001085 [Papaver atlanticum]|uniref:Uncharacterized protein n=1 Tax=Papaver atlanticum TaxID=357466 RepID=A0AAD4XKV7_9MAGN|nr:hypothetical protein MKW98_001085 [Papaver atlanticum]
MRMMISDVVVGNLMSVYLGLIAALKLFGVLSGRSFSGMFVVLVSSAAVLFILLSTLSWDVSRKAAAASSSLSSSASSSSAQDYNHQNRGAHKCRGGICWHGTVSVRSTVSQVRFRLPPHHHHQLPPPPLP